MTMSPFFRRPWFLALAVLACAVSVYLVLQARRPSDADAANRERCRAMYQAARTAAESLTVDTYMFMSEHPRGMTSCERYRH
jgi:hypothetical protein